MLDWADELLCVHCLKAFLTGWTNTLTFVRYGCFGTMQTGNGILLARAMSDGRWNDSLLYAIIIAAYYLGLIVFRSFDLFMSIHASEMVASQSKLLGPFYFLLLLSADACAWIFGSENRYELCFVALAFGGMNSLAVQISPVVTHAITGNLNRVANAAFDCLFEDGGLSESKRREALLSLWVSITFLTGVAACGVFVHSFKSLTHLGFLPVAIGQVQWLWSHDCVFAREKQARQAARMEARDAAAAARLSMARYGRQSGASGKLPLDILKARTVSAPDLSQALLVQGL